MLLDLLKSNFGVKQENLFHSVKLNTLTCAFFIITTQHVAIPSCCINFNAAFTVPLKSKLPVSSRFSRDESLVSRDESLVSRDESLVSRDESLVSRDSLKRQFWNKLQANCLARSRLQYSAKVMRTNFALFSSKYRRTFDRYFAAFVRQLNEISATIRQGKRKIESKNCFFKFSK